MSPSQMGFVNGLKHAAAAYPHYGCEVNVVFLLCDPDSSAIAGGGARQPRLDSFNFLRRGTAREGQLAWCEMCRCSPVRRDGRDYAAREGKCEDYSYCRNVTCGPSKIRQWPVN